MCAVTPEWAESWGYYCVEPELFSLRTRRWFAAYRTGERGGPPAPYHLFPCMLQARQQREHLPRVALAVTRWLGSALLTLRALSGGRCAAGLGNT